MALAGGERGPNLWTAATRLAAAVCGVLSVGAMWLFARRMFGQQVANLTALSMAVLPIFRMNASDSLSDTPHLVFYLLAAWCAAEGFTSGRARWWAATGLAGGLAFWVRPEGLEAPLVAGVLLAASLVLGLRSRREAIGSMAALGAALIVVVGPYVVLAGKITSKQLPLFKHESVPLFIVTESQEAARIAAKEKLHIEPAAVETSPADATRAETTPAETATAEAVAETAAPRSASIAAPARAEVASSAISGRVAMKVAGRATFTFLRNMTWGFRFAFVPLYLLGNWEMLRRRVAWWKIALPAGMGVLHIAVLYWVFFLSGYMDQRHVMVLVALALPFAGLGMCYVAEMAQYYLQPRVSQQAALATVLALACVVVVPRALTPMNADLAPVFKTAQWVRDHAGPGEGVISNTPFVAFYGQTSGVRLAPETASIETALLAGSRELKYDFAVLDLKVEGYRPTWREQIEREFDEVMRLNDPNGLGTDVKLLVYRRRTAETANAQETSHGAERR